MSRFAIFIYCQMHCFYAAATAVKRAATAAKTSKKFNFALYIIFCARFFMLCGDEWHSEGERKNAFKTVCFCRISLIYFSIAKSIKKERNKIR